MATESRARAGAHGYDEVRGRSRANILDPVFVIGMDESQRARPHNMPSAVNGEFDCSLANEPHLGMHMMVRRMWHAAGRQSGFVCFQGFTRSKLALQNRTKLGVFRSVHRQFLNEYVAEGNELSSVARASNRTVAG